MHACMRACELVCDMRALAPELRTTRRTTLCTQIHTHTVRQTAWPVSFFHGGGGMREIVPGEGLDEGA
jgi:hypothetical protein